MTVVDPLMIGCGKAGPAMSKIRAAGNFPTITVVQHGGMIGIPGIGTGKGGVGGGKGVKHAWKSSTLACGGPGI